MAQPAGERACPSTAIDLGTHLFGVVGPDRRVHPVRPPLPIDDEFRERAKAHGSPEARLRFTGPCIEGRCQQWANGRCTIADATVDEVTGVELDTTIRPCALRQACRWFAQRGIAACRVCPLVITDSRPALR